MTLLVVAGVVAAWLIGSIPTAYLVGRANGVDLRTVGSGNLGATNVFRTLGWKWGLVVYAVDVAKGALPVFWLPVGKLTGAMPPEGDRIIVVCPLLLWSTWTP